MCALQTGGCPEGVARRGAQLLRTLPHKRDQRQANVPAGLCEG